MMSLKLVVFGLLSGCVAASTSELSMGANPIRKVVTLMQNMQKELEAEGEKEKELYDKFMCFCQSSGGELTKTVADAKAAIDEFTAKVESETAEKAQIEQELVDHKADRESAKADLEAAASIRAKEAGATAATKADVETNVAAMASAIPALEKGLGGAALMQMPGSHRLKKLIASYPGLESVDRQDVTAFLEQSEDAPGSGQIVGILKQMQEEFEANLKSLNADEAAAVAGFAELKASKEKEVEIASEAIESKMGRSGALAVAVVQSQDGVEDSQKEAKDSEAMIASLTEQCATKEGENAESIKARTEEVSAIGEAIAILNDDDALDTFKKAIPSAFNQEVQWVGLLQTGTGLASRGQKAKAILEAIANKRGSTQLHLMLFTLNQKLKNKGRGGLGDVVTMIDDMVVLLGKQQKEDDKQKEWCTGEFDKAGDEEVAVKTKLTAVEASLAEMADEVTVLAEEVKNLKYEVNEIDQEVVAATEQRKEEHVQYSATVQMSEAAAALVEKAKARLNKLYNPAPAAAAFIQVRSHLRSQQKASMKVKRSAKGGGVIQLMDSIIHDLAMSQKDAENAEKTGQKDYAELMDESRTTRAQLLKNSVNKDAAKAELEQKLVADKESQASLANEAKLAATYISDLHGSCDFIMQNHDMRQEARANEVDSLKNAKAVLSGAQ